MAVSGIVLFGVALAILVGIYFNQPIPDGLPQEQHNGMRFYAASIKTFYIWASLASSLGFGNTYENFRLMTRKAANVLAKEETSLDIKDSKIANVPVRIYKPKDFSSNHKKLIGLVYFHGGGWTFGSYDTYHPLTQKIAKEVEVVLVSVNYRLAPESTFPSPFHDCYSVAKTLLAQGEQYGIDTDRIVLAGDSAGGNLAAAVALRLKDEQKKPAAQILIYPALQFADFNLPSYKKQQTNILLSTSDVARFWSIYLTGSVNMASSFLASNHSSHLRNTKYFSYIGFQDKQLEKASQRQASSEISEVVVNALTDYRAAPLMADDLKGLPKTMLITCEFDVLKDDGLLFKTRLVDAGVKVTHFNYMTYHAFLSLQASQLFVSDEWRHAVQDIVTYVKEL